MDGNKNIAPLASEMYSALKRQNRLLCGLALALLAALATQRAAGRKGTSRQN